MIAGLYIRVDQLISALTACEQSLWLQQFLLLSDRMTKHMPELDNDSAVFFAGK